MGTLDIVARAAADVNRKRARRRRRATGGEGAKQGGETGWDGREREGLFRTARMIRLEGRGAAAGESAIDGMASGAARLGLVSIRPIEDEEMQMLTALGCRGRRQRLWDQLAEKPDWIVISDEASLVYFANYYQTPFVFRTAEAAAVLILGADGSSILVTDSMVRSMAEQAHVDELVTPVWYRAVETAPHRRSLLVQSVLERMQKCPGGKIGYDAGRTAAGIVEGLRAARPGVAFTAIDPVVHLLRRKKDPDELALIRASLRAIDAGHAAGMRDIRPGMNEYEAFLVVQNACMREAGDQVQVYGDFVSGERCQAGGGPPSNRVIQKGDLVLLDFSAVIRGYRGDTCNTFVCGGQPTDEMRRHYDACLEALIESAKLVRAGTTGQAIDRAVRDVFDRQHCGEFFNSHSGHGLGLGHPDPPYLVSASTDTLVAGDVIAIEPSQKLPGKFGMRYEHNYLVTETGSEQLSQHRLTLEV